MALAAWTVGLLVGVPLYLRAGTAHDAPAAGAPVLHDYAPATFTSTEGRFSAEFPSKPVQTRLHVGDVVQTQFVSVTDHGIVRVSYRDFVGTLAEGDAAKLLEAAVDKAGAAGRIVSQSAAIVGGSPAVDFAIDGGDGHTLLGRVIVVGTEQPRQYLLMAGPGDAASTRAAWERLLDTFTLQG